MSECVCECVCACVRVRVCVWGSTDLHLSGVTSRSLAVLNVSPLMCEENHLSWTDRTLSREELRSTAPEVPKF